ncbi:MAG: class I SAM-dependent methyltransferase [Candidatus Bathyarchaeia archaeon]
MRLFRLPKLHTNHEDSPDPKTDKEFDYQWKYLPSPFIEYTEKRVEELLDLTKLSHSFFENKLCLDAGCGNGRWTYAMMRMGAKVASFDISSAAVQACKQVNPEAYVGEIDELKENRIYDFVLCWGVLHHLSHPELGFKKVASQVKPGGTLHIMVYDRNTQKQYEEGRRLWKEMSHEQKLSYCKKMIKKHGGNLHGWWDALNPAYNYSYTPSEVETWFTTEGFRGITFTKNVMINMRGVYPST